MGAHLITGAAGFIGFALADALAADETQAIVMVDDFSRGERDAAYSALSARPNVTAIEADLSDPAAVASLPREIDTIFHLAALNGTQNFYERPFDVVRACTLPTLNLLQTYGRSGSLKRFFYAGTSEAYAGTVSQFGWEVPTGEDVPLSIADVTNARWSYGGSKLHGEIAVINAARQYGMAHTIARYHNVYGPRMGDKHVIPDFLTRLREGRCELFGHADTRSFLYVDDAVRATIELASCAEAAGEIVNIGGPDEITMEALGRLMMELAGESGPLILHPSPAGSVPRRAPKLDKLRGLIDFQPQHDLHAGLRRTMAFYMPEARA